MSKLTDFKLLSFDVYGTIIDWETGIIEAFQASIDKDKKSDLDRKHVLEVCHSLEAPEQDQNPDMIYSELLTTIHPKLCAKLGLSEPTKEESKAFGDSVEQWPAFPDSIDALKRLQKAYKLVVLSNVDNTSFSASNAGPLEGFHFDAVFTAQEIGSYKPDLKNFEYMLKQVRERFGIEKGQVLQTAQSQFHDHHPAKKAGLKSSWICRPGAIMGNREGPQFDWKFDTLGEMADAVEKELAQK